MTQLLNGLEVMKYKRNILQEKVSYLVKENKRVPHLCVVLVGDDPASRTYVNAKAKQCERVGFESSVKHFEATMSQEKLIKVIETLNADEKVDGILIQLPLPRHINESEVLDHLDPRKDVDGLHPLNAGLLLLGTPQYIPCTPKGIMSILDYYKIEIQGKRALVIGRSRLVGKPIAALLTNRNATVTLAHSRTANIEQLIQEHELIIVAIGKPEYFSGNMFTDKHVVIDVGIHTTDSGLTGDVAKDAYTIVRAITPVPKGVGPMTIQSLLENTYDAYELKENHNAR